MQWTPEARDRPIRGVLEALQRKARPHVQAWGDRLAPGLGDVYNSAIQTGTEAIPGVGDVAGVEDLQVAASENDWGGMGLGLLAALPLVPGIARGARGGRGARRTGGLIANAAAPAPHAGQMDSPGYRVRSEQYLTPEEMADPALMRAQGYEIDPERNVWAKVVGTEEAPASLQSAITYNGQTYTGATHMDALAAIPDPLDRVRATADGSNRGFVDAAGRVLDRRKAQRYAVEHNLFADDAPSWAATAPELNSESLRRQADPAPAPTPAYPIRAYHGSPHSFDRFSLDKIGTGEGAQAYGHGLYFAESEDVARQYRDTLSANTIRGTDGQTFRNRFIGDSEDFVGAVDDIANGAGVPDVSPWMRRQIYGGYGSIIEDAFTKVDGNWDVLPDTLRRTADEHAAGLRATGEPEDRIREVYDTYNNAAKVVEHANATGVGRNPGSMYEVGINAHPDTFLDWDARLSREQLETTFADYPEVLGGDAFQRRFLKGEDSGYTGSQAYARAAGWNRGADLSPEAARASDVSRALAERGVPGIRYLDGNSRGVGEGSSNYVVFNEELVKILRKYGISGLGLSGGLGLGGGLVAGQQEQPATTF
jgi:hypothetical protein